jgi:hypothetical protein
MDEEFASFSGKRTARILVASVVSLFLVVGILFSLDIFTGVDSAFADLISMFMFGFVGFTFIMVFYYYFNHAPKFEEYELVEIEGEGE